MTLFVYILKVYWVYFIIISYIKFMESSRRRIGFYATMKQVFIRVIFMNQFKVSTIFILQKIISLTNWSILSNFQQTARKIQHSIAHLFTSVRPKTEKDEHTHTTTEWIITCRVGTHAFVIRDSCVEIVKRRNHIFSVGRIVPESRRVTIRMY